MRFQSWMLDAIEDRSKTVTRRLVRFTEGKEMAACPYREGRIYMATDRPRWEVSGTKRNEVKGWRSRPIKVKAITVENLSMITDEGAGYEGFRPTGTLMSRRDEFLVLWGKLHGFDPKNPDPLVWVVEFQRVPKRWVKR